MEFWIILDGEKAGPFQDYDIRSRIDRGELTRKTPAWHQGLDAWRTLGEIALFDGEFEMMDGETGLGSAPDETEADRGMAPREGPPPLPQPQALGRRFWARWLDIHMYLAAWWLGMWASGSPIGAALNSVFMLLVQLVPWFIVESILLHRYGTTPGKWLLGLSVENADGTRLSQRAAVLRSFWILIGGIGFGWSMLALACQTFSFITVRMLGRPIWDHVGGHVVRVSPLVPWRVGAVVVGMFLAIQLQMAVISPYVLKTAVETFPTLKKTLEENPPWHLPPND